MLMPKSRTAELLSDIRIDIRLLRRHEITDHRHTSPNDALLVEGGLSNSVQDMPRKAYLIRRDRWRLSDSNRTSLVNSGDRLLLDPNCASKALHILDVLSG